MKILFLETNLDFGARERFEDGESLLQRHLVAVCDFRRFEPHSDQILRLGEKRARQDDHEISTVAHLDTMGI